MEKIGFALKSNDGGSSLVEGAKFGLSLLMKK